MSTVPTTIEEATEFLKANPTIHALLKAGAHITIRLPAATKRMLPPSLFLIDEHQSVVSDLDMKDLLEEMRKLSAR